MNKKHFSTGTLVLKEGSTGEEIFFIVTGKVKVFKTINHEEIELAILGPDEFFGEMSMFNQSKRSASVKAIEDSEIMVGNRKIFISTIRKDPNKAIHIISTLTKRLKDAHGIISEIEGERKSYEILLAPFDR